MSDTILIIEDEPFQQSLMEKIVTDLGYDAHLCPDGKEGVDYIKDGVDHIIAVLLDIYMPQIDGISVLGHFISRYPELPIIVVTGTDDEEDVSVCLGLGAKAVIKKPFKGDELKDILSEAIGCCPQGS